MSDLNFFDKYGVSIDHFMQWDLNQIIYIENIDLKYPPLFHFCNKNSEEAIVVGSTIENDFITVKVPNILLQEATPLIIYIYAYDSTDYESRTLYTITLPVRPRIKPSNYTYVENLEYVYASIVEQRIRDYISDLNLNNYKITYSTPNTRSNISSGETLSVMFGKIRRMYADLKAVAWSGSYSDLTGKPTIVNNLTTTTENTVLDGRVGKTLSDKIETINSTLSGFGSTLSGLGTASTYAVANNVTTTATGYVLDARQGKSMNDKITANTNKITANTNSISNINILFDGEVTKSDIDALF